MTPAGKLAAECHIGSNMVPRWPGPLALACSRPVGGFRGEIAPPQEGPSTWSRSKQNYGKRGCVGAHPHILGQRSNGSGVREPLQGLDTLFGPCRGTPLAKSKTPKKGTPRGLAHALPTLSRAEGQTTREPTPAHPSYTTHCARQPKRPKSSTSPQDDLPPRHFPNDATSEGPQTKCESSQR